MQEFSAVIRNINKKPLELFMYIRKQVDPFNLVRTNSYKLGLDSGISKNRGNISSYITQLEKENLLVRYRPTDSHKITFLFVNPYYLEPLQDDPILYEYYDLIRAGNYSWEEQNEMNEYFGYEWA